MALVQAAAEAAEAAAAAAAEAEASEATEARAPSVVLAFDFHLLSIYFNFISS